MFVVFRTWKMKSTGDQISNPDATSTFPSAKNNSSRAPSIWLSKRLLVAILLFLGMVLGMMQILMGTMALLEMTTAKRFVSGNTTTIRPPEFNWDSVTVGVILNMAYYGSFLSPIGGTISQKFGGSVTCGVSMLLIGLLTIIMPIALYCNFYLFLAFRGLVGVLVTFVSTSHLVIFANWLPKKERPAFISIIMNGGYVGATIVNPFCGYISYGWGWQMIFYTIGFLFIAWSVIWLILVRNNPSDDKRISKNELAYILEGTVAVNKTQNNNYPYKEVLTSSAIWGLLVAKWANSWAITPAVQDYPLYIRDKTQKSTIDVGNISSIPQLFDIILIPIAGVAMGYWQNHGNLSDTQIHKIVFSSQLITCAVLFTVVSILDEFFGVNICFIIMTVLLSYNRVVLELITVSMAPSHCALVSGISSLSQNFGIIASQTFIGFIVKNHRVDEWNICFLTSTGVLMITSVIFILHGSSKPQSWSTEK